MSVLYLVVPVALLLVGAALAAFAWAARGGQFDDVTTPAMRALQDDARHLPLPVRRSRPPGQARVRTGAQAISVWSSTHRPTLPQTEQPALPSP